MAKQTTTEPLTISPEKAADKLGLSPSKIRQMLHSGILPGFKMDKRWLISVKALEAWVDKQISGI
ncbi:MAG: helix-turn-helix domain-containing protein [Syntrophomonas sp.]